MQSFSVDLRQKERIAGVLRGLPFFRSKQRWIACVRPVLKIESRKRLQTILQALTQAKPLNWTLQNTKQRKSLKVLITIWNSVIMYLPNGTTLSEAIAVKVDADIALMDRFNDEIIFCPKVI